MTDIYRQAASVVLLRPSSVCSPDGCGQVYQVLLLHKPRKNDAWQLPQGGLEEGETIEEAALRELSEEAGITDITVLGSCTKCYKYDFPESYRRFRPDNVCGQCIFFVFALADQNVKVQEDGKEIDSHTWIDPEQIPQFLKRKEYLELVQMMIKEAIKHAENSQS